MHAACDLVEQRARALANPGRAAERARIRGLARRVASRTAYRRCSSLSNGGSGVPVAWATSSNKRSNVLDRDAEHRIAVAGAVAQLALEAVGVVQRGHDQHGIARRATPSGALELLPACPEFGGPTIRDSDIAPSIGRRTAPSSVPSDAGLSSLRHVRCASSIPRTRSARSPTRSAARRAGSSSARPCGPGSTRSPTTSSRPTTPGRSRSSTSTTSRCWPPGTPRWTSATRSRTATS